MKVLSHRAIIEHIEHIARICRQIQRIGSYDGFATCSLSIEDACSTTICPQTSLIGTVILRNHCRQQRVELEQKIKDLGVALQGLVALHGVVSCPMRFLLDIYKFFFLGHEGIFELVGLYFYLPYMNI